jgi:pyruvate dehydrogenase E2 component (dihydrolipoamide acetyltransferase)
MTDIKLPELGEGISSVEISDVLVKTGDNIKLDDSLIVVETEKASMEIPATSSGIVNKIHVNKGESISPGDIIISISGDDVNTSESESTIEDENAEIKNTDSDTLQLSSSNIIDTLNHTETPSTTSHQGKPVLASPSVRRFSRELGCDLKKVNGTGPKGRITKEDVQKYIKARLTGISDQSPTLPLTSHGQNMDFSKFGDIDIQPLNKIKRITGQRLQQAWQAIPHVTQFDRCEIGHLEKLRVKWKKDNTDSDIRASLVPFFIKAASKLLIEMPQFNSSLDNSNSNLVLKKYLNVGVAVDTEEGLVVPVIKDVKAKSILEIARELTLISRKARDKKLKPSDLEGGCFTISSLGGIGGTYFTPIVNPPEVAILGISKSIKEPVVVDGQIKEKLMLPFSLSYDHRVIDGVDAVRFTTEFGIYLSKFDKLQ